MSCEAQTLQRSLSTQAPEDFKVSTRGGDLRALAFQAALLLELTLKLAQETGENQNAAKWDAAVGWYNCGLECWTPAAGPAQTEDRDENATVEIVLGELEGKKAAAEVERKESATDKESAQKPSCLETRRTVAAQRRAAAKTQREEEKKATEQKLEALFEVVTMQEGKISVSVVEAPLGGHVGWKVAGKKGNVSPAAGRKAKTSSYAVTGARWFTLEANEDRWRGAASEKTWRPPTCGKRAGRKVAAPAAKAPLRKPQRSKEETAKKRAASERPFRSACKTDQEADRTAEAGGAAVAEIGGAAAEEVAAAQRAEEAREAALEEADAEEDRADVEKAALANETANAEIGGAAAKKVAAEDRRAGVGETALAKGAADADKGGAAAEEVAAAKCDDDVGQAASAKDAAEAAKAGGAAAKNASQRKKHRVACKVCGERCPAEHAFCRACGTRRPPPE